MNQCHRTCQALRKCDTGADATRATGNLRGLEVNVDRRMTCRPSAALCNIFVCVCVWTTLLKSLLQLQRELLWLSSLLRKESIRVLSHTHTHTHTHTRIKMATHHQGNKQQSNLIILSLQSSKTPAAPGFFYVVLLYMYDGFHSVHRDTRTGVDVWANARKMPVCSNVYLIPIQSRPCNIIQVKTLLPLILELRNKLNTVWT